MYIRSSGRQLRQSGCRSQMTKSTSSADILPKTGNRKHQLGIGTGFNRVIIAVQCTATYKIYSASPSITSQLVLFLWRTVEIVPLGHVRVVEALENFVQKCDPVTLSGIHTHIAGVQQFHCR